MTLAAGQSLTHYEILEPIGAGAMGEVWRARDTKLGREVAVKVLPEHFARDEERLQRFEREARSLASLNHGNVAQIYGVDQVDDTCFLVLELVPGETLGERLARGPLPVAQAVDVCRQIAAGLEAAHEAGVIHRDLKPDNVRVTPDGEVKLLDFGLARGFEAPGSGGASRQESAALTTEEGRLLGTPSYMAPEQARGGPVDRRVDVWALGCVLFECLAGRRPFAGATASDVIAAVLEHEPDVSQLPAATPPRLRELVQRSLRKDPRVRLRDAGDARVLLEELAAGADDTAPTTAERRGVPLAALLLVALGSAAVGWFAGRPRPEEPLPTPVAITTSQYMDQKPTWNPDGSWIAFTRMTSGSNDIWLKDLSSGHERLRRGGPGDQSAPAWSPVGDYIAYVTTDRPGTPIMLMPPHEEGSRGERKLIDTGVRTFDSAEYGATLGNRPWANDGTWLLVSRVTDGRSVALFRVGRDDGSLEQLTSPPFGSGDLAASLSLDGNRIAFLRASPLGPASVLTMPAEGGEPEVLFGGVGNMASPCWTPDGTGVVYLDQGVWRYDLADGSRRRIAAMPPDSMHVGLSMTTDGRLAYAVGWHDTSIVSHELATGELTWLNRHSSNNFSPRYSPSGHEVAYNSMRTGDVEVWVREADGGERRITRDPSWDGFPDWSPNGDRLVFASDRDGSFKLYISDRDGNDGRLLWDRALSLSLSGALVRWSPRTPAGELVGCIVSEASGSALWGVPPGAPELARELLDDVVGFDWYLDSTRVLYTPDVGLAEELVAVDLRNGERRVLWTGPHAEIDVAPDGTSVIFCSGAGHLGMGLARLQLEPPSGTDRLPRAVGEPVDIVRPEGVWHVHNADWSPDGERVAFVHDADRSTIYELAADALR